jgi:hypothetical protein
MFSDSTDMLADVLNRKRTCVGLHFVEYVNGEAFLLATCQNSG